MHSPSEKLLTRRALAEFLTERGFPISYSTLKIMAMPSRGGGPPAEAAWGNRLLYDPNKALKWAKARLSDAAALSRRASVSSEISRPARAR
jgi:hypothetical protein